MPGSTNIQDYGETEPPRKWRIGLAVLGPSESYRGLLWEVAFFAMFSHAQFAMDIPFKVVDTLDSTLHNSIKFYEVRYLPFFC